MTSIQLYKGKCDNCEKINPDHVIEIISFKKGNGISFWCLDCVATKGKVNKNE